MTNYEKIKNMNMKELALFLCLNTHIIKGGSDCGDCSFHGTDVCIYKMKEIEQWLEWEAKND